MNRPLSLVLYRVETSRYSLYALAGALESRRRFDALPMHFPHDEKDLLRQAAAIHAAGRRAVVAFSFPTACRDAVARAVRSIRGTGFQPVSDGRGAHSASRHGQDARATHPFLIAGGAHPTALPEDALSLGFDLIAVGEGEATFVDLMDHLDEGDDWRSVAGIAYLDPSNRCVVNPSRPPIDLDDYAPSPARLGRFGHIEITRGCPFGCAFCQTSAIHGRRPRHRSVERIAHYVELMRRTGLLDVRFIAPDAFAYGSPDGRQLNLESIENLLRRVRETAGPEARIYFGTFPSEVRPEHVTPETLDLVRRYAHNDLLIVGAQAGSDRLLEACRRGHTVQDVYAAVRLIRRAGLDASVDFIFGLPGETDEDRRQTARVMTDLAAMGARIHAHSFMPLPQTPFASCAPGRAEGEIREAANRLLSSGDLYGNWETQEGLARAFRRFGAEAAGTPPRLS
jgi:B12-binding domain/radical SAM domain protein